MAASADDIRHKRADDGLVKVVHHLVEQGKENVPETLRRELCMSVLAASVRRGKGVVFIFVVMVLAHKVCGWESKFSLILLFTVES